jgi:hypothetical protein
MRRRRDDARRRRFARGGVRVGAKRPGGVELVRVQHLYDLSNAAIWRLAARNTRRRQPASLRDSLPTIPSRAARRTPRIQGGVCSSGGTCITIGHRGFPWSEEGGSRTVSRFGFYGKNEQKTSHISKIGVPTPLWLAGPCAPRFHPNAWAGAHAQPRAQIPYLVASKPPRPYQFAARIQSFQSVAAPFPGGFRPLAPTIPSRLDLGSTRLSPSGTAMWEQT